MRNEPHHRPRLVRLAMRQAGIGTGEFARRLGVPETAARRLLDPRRDSKAETLERALLAVGQRLEIEVPAAA